MQTKAIFSGLAALLVLCALAANLLGQQNPSVGKKKLQVAIKPQHVADALKAVIISHREVYAHAVQSQSNVPAPCEVVRQGSEAVASKGVEYSYLLRSLQPINKRNAPETETEIKALQQVAQNPESPFYSEELLGGRWYLTAVYPDIAVNQSCVSCHNARQASPGKSYKIGDVIGGLVVRVALEL